MIFLERGIESIFAASSFNFWVSSVVKKRPNYAFLAAE
jgi:hypothetical protein